MKAREPHRVLTDSKFHAVGGVLGKMLLTCAPLLLLPIVVAFIYREHQYHYCFILPGLLSGFTGWLLVRKAKHVEFRPPAGLLICGMGWIVLSLFGCLPYVLGIGASFVDAYFETVSGFTTTGITVFSGLDAFPRSILFWRAFTQWLGGLGIITFYLAIVFRGGGFTFRMFSAESHKISSSRPTPNIFKTVQILWAIYILFSLLQIGAYILADMGAFDAVVHTFTSLSTGGFSSHDASIGYYAQQGYAHSRAIEYITIVFMLLGGINFLVHFQVLRGKISSLWKPAEMRYLWGLLLASTLLVVGDIALSGPISSFLAAFEAHCRTALFTVVSIFTTTGFGTTDINAAYFPALARQVLLLLMLIGGCVGSTGGGIKVLRVVILWRMFKNEFMRLVLPHRAVDRIVIDGNLVPYSEIRKAAGLFFGWLLFIAAGGFITAASTNLSAWSSFSGMFSAMGNIGPCFIRPEHMGLLPAGVKVTYIVGMLAGRLEILPIILLFIPRAWR